MLGRRWKVALGHLVENLSEKKETASGQGMAVHRSKAGRAPSALFGNDVLSQVFSPWSLTQPGSLGEDLYLCPINQGLESREMDLGLGTQADQGGPTASAPFPLNPSF